MKSISSSTILVLMASALFAVSSVDASSGALRTAPAEEMSGETVQILPFSSNTHHEQNGHQPIDFDDKCSYKKISTYWEDRGWYCWDATTGGINGNYPVPYAEQCKYGSGDKDDQDWIATKYGQLHNKKWAKCLTYDWSNKYDAYYGQYKVHMVLDDCHDDWMSQKFHYVDNHWVSYYDSKCVDLNRDGGGFYEMQPCKHYLKDQDHKIENKWFCGWDDSAKCY